MADQPIPPTWPDTPDERVRIILRDLLEKLNASQDAIRAIAYGDAEHPGVSAHRRRDSEPRFPYIDPNTWTSGTPGPSGPSGPSGHDNDDDNDDNDDDNDDDGPSSSEEE